MDDITMCTANGCPMADRCYRHTQGDTDNPNQSWVNFEYTCNERSSFNNYILYIKSDE